MSLLKLNVGPFSYDGVDGHEKIVVKWKENHFLEVVCELKSRTASTKYMYRAEFLDDSNGKSDC